MIPAALAGPSLFGWLALGRYESLSFPTSDLLFYIPAIASVGFGRVDVADEEGVVVCVAHCDLGRRIRFVVCRRLRIFRVGGATLAGVVIGAR